MINGIKPLPSKTDFDSALDGLVEDIHKDYAKWSSRVEYSSFSNLFVPCSYNDDVIVEQYNLSLLGLVSNASILYISTYVMFKCLQGYVFCCHCKDI